MKLWQLISIFRDEKNIIDNEVKKKEWEFYSDLYKNIEVIVKHQKRDILDMQVDNKLLKNICSQSKKKIYYSIGNSTIYSYKIEDNNKEIPILEAIDLFKHDAIEEVFEKTSSQIT